jgi:hypothetical protein
MPTPIPNVVRDFERGDGRFGKGGGCFGTGGGAEDRLSEGSGS